MINVLVVEDSAVVAEFLSYLLNSDPEIHVVGIARNGEEAIKAAINKKPDVITMDIDMPGMNGFEATRRIMEITPTPIVIVSASYDPKEVTTTFQAIEAGALAIVGKPKGIGHSDLEQSAREFMQTVKLMSEVKVVRRWPKRNDVVSVIEPRLELKRVPREIRVVAIGASTGGPIVLQTILALLPKTFPVPVLIAQHMASGFTEGFAQWLTESTGFPVHVAVDGQNPTFGNAYVAPDGFHLRLDKVGRIGLTKDEPENGLRPSASYLFRSVLNIFGANAVGILLSGMGKDGAEELKLMKEKGALTIVQDKETCVVFGMPGEAVKLDAASYVLPPEKIAAALKTLVAR